MDESWSRIIHTIGEEIWEEFVDKSKRTCVDEVENLSKKVAFSSKPGETISMPLPKAITPKHTKVLDLNNDDDFSSRLIQSASKSTLPHYTKGIYGLSCFLCCVVV
jgi:hypothetical protein